MGVCLINEHFEELRFDYYEKEKEKDEKKERTKQNFIKGQQIITVNKFQIEKIKKQRLIKKKTHDINHLSIEKNKEILLLSSGKNDRAKTESANFIENNKLIITASVRSKKYNIINYPKDVFELINKIRSNPGAFIKDVEIAITNIKKYKNKLVYNGNIKIYLNNGEKIFQDAIEYLKKTKPMDPLIFNQEIGIEMPTEEEYYSDKDFFKKRILKEKKIKKIERYYREAILDPYTGVLMMIVDDTIKNQGEKRITILNPLLKKVSINCQMYGNRFLAYLIFSK